MKIGIIGAGAIAQFVLEQLKDSQQRVTAVFVRDQEKYEELAARFDVALYTEIDAFLASDIDIVVEAAGLDAVKAYMPMVVQHKPAVVISVGALADQVLLAQLQQLATAHQQAIYLPSGAIGGLDLLQNAAALGGVTHVSLVTTKPAQALASEGVTEAYTIFEGNAAQAIAQFPQNMNVSIVLALAGLGFTDTKVKLIADPAATQNMHEIVIQGAFGEATVTVKNNPLPTNPKTSYLAALSIIGTLQRLQQPFHLGS